MEKKVKTCTVSIQEAVQEKEGLDASVLKK